MVVRKLLDLRRTRADRVHALAARAVELARTPEAVASILDHAQKDGWLTDHALAVPHQWPRPGRTDAAPAPTYETLRRPEVTDAVRTSPHPIVATETAIESPPRTIARLAQLTTTIDDPHGQPFTLAWTATWLDAAGATPLLPPAHVHADLLAAALAGMRLDVHAPDGLEPAFEILAWAERIAVVQGGTLELVGKPPTAIAGGPRVVVPYYPPAAFAANTADAQALVERHVAASGATLDDWRLPSSPTLDLALVEAATAACVEWASQPITPTD